jgi:hypothetical protein
MKKIIALSIFLLALTSCDDGVFFSPRGKTYIYQVEKPMGVTLSFTTNNKGVWQNWKDYEKGIICEENDPLYLYPRKENFTYTLNYPKLTLMFNDSLMAYFSFISEDTIVNTDENSSGGHLLITKFVRIE